MYEKNDKNNKFKTSVDADHGESERVDLIGLDSTRRLLGSVKNDLRI